MKLLNCFATQSRTLFFSTLIIILAFGFGAMAQPGGLDVFKSKNPTVKKTSGGAKSSKAKKPKGKKSPKLTPAEIEEIYENALETGNLARDQRNYVAAEKAYNEGVGVKPKDFRAHYGLGNVYADQQRWDDAEKAYRAALLEEPKSADINTALSFVLVQHTSGNVAAKLVEAERTARRAIQIEPNNAVAYDRLGVALETRNIMSEETEQAFRRSTEIDPSFALAHAHLARFLWKKNKRNDAEKSYRRAIELAQDAPTLTLIAESYQSDQRFADSEPLLVKALQLDEKYPPALYYLGKAFVATARFEDAIAVLRKSVEANSQAFAPQYLLASVYHRANRLSEAEAAYIEAVKLASPTEQKQVAGAYGFTGLGDIFLQKRRPADALRCYERARKLDPDNKEILRKIALANQMPSN
jgi:cytochrome c-type biogenesis protein CcmH/NrfG